MTFAKYLPAKEEKPQQGGTLNPINADNPDLEVFKKMWIKLKMGSDAND